MAQNLRKRARYVSGWVVFKICSLINWFLPLSFIYFLSNILGTLAYHLVGRFRKVSFESLRIALGDFYSPREQKIIVKETMRNFMRMGLEIFAFIYRPELMEKFISVEGISHLDEALAKGRGVVGLTGHFGSFPLLCLKLVSLGYKVNVMVRPLRDRRMDRELMTLRTKRGVNTIYSYPRSRAIRDSLKVLRENQILIIQMDQNFGSGGIWINFFGKKAATPKGPVVFALRTKASIVPMFIIRDKLNPKKQKVIIEKPQTLERCKEIGDSVQENVQKFTALLEDYIRRYPEHWGWMHRRWKSKREE